MMKNLKLTLFSLIFTFNIAAQPVTAHKPTVAIIAYCEHLVEQNIIGPKHIQRLINSADLTNPLTQDDAALNHAAYIHYTTLNSMITAAHHAAIDCHAITAWAHYKIAELTKTEEIRQDVHHETHDVHRTMNFASLPAGTYTDLVDGTEFELPTGIEIQDTPVTQYQWMRIMGSNPSHFVEGASQEIIDTSLPHRYHPVNNILLLPDHPVENISLEMAHEFIHKLNLQDSEYTYALPSIQEFSALVQAAYGSLERLSSESSHTPTDHTHAVTTGTYAILNGKRVWDIVGNVWCFTRDMSQQDRCLNQRVFIRLYCYLGDKYSYANLIWGGSYATRITDIQTKNLLVRPVYYKSSFAPCLGLRLVRRKKQYPTPRTQKNYLHLSFTSALTQYDNTWTWDWITHDTALLFFGDAVQYMMKHRAEYSRDLQPLITKLSQYGDISQLKTATFFSMCHNDIRDIRPLTRLNQIQILLLTDNHIIEIPPLAQLTQLAGLWLSDNGIQDITPLAQLTQLRELHLDHNPIQNIQPLAQLTRLEILTLDGNQIQNIAPVAQLNQLTILRLSKNQIQDVKPLAQLTNLKELGLKGNPIDPKDIAWLKQQLPKTKISF